MKQDRSRALYEEACAVLPGGVDSPVRAFRSVGGTPITFRRGSGSVLEDWDGNQFLDYCCSWGPLVLGHADPAVRARISETLADGWTFGAPHRSETLLARKVLELLGWAEQVRFVNSGTEAVMTALRLARGVTGRPLVVKFDGCYHGHLDSLLVNAGSGLATFGSASSAGVPSEIAATTLVAPLDDESAVEKLFAAHADRIAAVIIEGLPANNGLLIQRQEFMTFLREVTRKHGALLICDEVLVGLRLPSVFAFAQYGIEPDLVTLGKVIGGGFPAAALAGRREIMEQLAPLGPVYQAGTLSGNPVAMTAGLATLERLFDEGQFKQLLDVSRRFSEKMEAGLEKLDLPVVFVHAGSIFWFALDAETAPRTAAGIAKSGIAKYAHFHRLLLEQGIYFAPSGYEVGFLSTTLTDADIERTVDIVLSALKEVYA